MAVMRHAGKNVVSSHRSMTRLFYNAMGGFYDLFYHRSIRGYVESADCLMKDLVREGDRVLDVGCGTGLLSYLALPQAKKVVGVDLAIGMLQKGKKKNTENQPAYFVNGDALHLPFAEPFDVCVSAFMLVMLPREKRWQVIAEMNRLLKPGGRMAFLTSRPELGEQWLTREEWRSGLDELGLTDIQIHDESDVFLNVTAVKPSKAAVREESLEPAESGSSFAEIFSSRSQIPAWSA
jgi:ubiquinone/menaquinone biosynthesis C-methylase UbiE